LKITEFMGNKSQLMWQKGYAIKTKSHIVVDMCMPSFFETQCIMTPPFCEELMSIKIKFKCGNMGDSSRCRSEEN